MARPDLSQYFYDVQNVLGSGSEGVVYKAKYLGQKKNGLKPNQEVAIKFTPAEKLRPNEVLYQARIRHINVIQIYDVIRINDNAGRVFVAVVMELADPSKHDLPGSSLWSCIENTVRENMQRVVFNKESGAEVRAPIIGGEPMVRWIFLQVASALDFLHRHPLRICNRDVKAENVLVVSFEPHADGVMRPVCKLADFGFSKGLLTGEPTTRLGTAFYVAPEIYLLPPGGEYDGPKADTWSAGVLLYTLRTGLRPFQDNPNVPDREIMNRATKQEHVNNLFVNLDRLGASPELVDLMKKMLTINPEKRINMKEVISHPWSRKLDRDIVAHVPVEPAGAGGAAAGAGDAPEQTVPQAFPCWTFLRDAAEEMVKEVQDAYDTAQNGEFVQFGWSLEEPYDQVEQMLNEVAAIGQRNAAAATAAAAAAAAQQA